MWTSLETGRAATGALTLFALCAGCDENTGGNPDARLGDAALAPDGDRRRVCVPAESWDRYHATVSGTVRGLQTQEPIAGVQVRVTTAWDLPGFPDDCVPRATFTTDANGRFGPMRISIGSPLTPPMVLFLVEGNGIVPTASDVRSGCAGRAPDCEDIVHDIRVPDEVSAARWRADLVAGGMMDAATGGLALFQYREAEDRPAQGVTPRQGLPVDESLEPGREVRFLDADAANLLPVGTQTTSASGWIIARLAAPAMAIFLRGRRNDTLWPPTGALIDTGWWFVEDQTPQ